MKVVGFFFWGGAVECFRNGVWVKVIYHKMWLEINNYQMILIVFILDTLHKMKVF